MTITSSIFDISSSVQDLTADLYRSVNLQFGLKEFTQSNYWNPWWVSIEPDSLAIKANSLRNMDKCEYIADF